MHLLFIHLQIFKSLIKDKISPDPCIEKIWETPFIFHGLKIYKFLSWLTSQYIKTTAAEFTKGVFTSVRNEPFLEIDSLTIISWEFAEIFETSLLQEHEWAFSGNPVKNTREQNAFISFIYGGFYKNEWPPLLNPTHPPQLKIYLNPPTKTST